MIEPARTALVLVDIQVRLARVMHEPDLLVDGLRRLVAGARALGLPVLWLEQYPEGLGPTVPEVAGLLEGLKPVTKLCFSAWGSPEFRRQLESGGRRQVLLAGIEGHVCVYQTAVDLLGAGYEVEVVGDAVSSRTAANRALGLARIQQAGARVTGVEMALFELLRTAEAHAFREIARLVK